MQPSLVKAFQKLGRFSAPELQLVESKLKRKLLPKGALLVPQGQVCQSVFFLQHGSCCHSICTEAGDVFVVNLYVDHDWVADCHSLTAQKPSAGTIQANETCEIYELELALIHELIKANPVFFQLGRLLELVQYPLSPTLEYPTPADHYWHLLANRPLVIQKFSLKQVASLLQIAPETLSRIRKRQQ